MSLTAGDLPEAMAGGLYLKEEEGKGNQRRIRKGITCLDDVAEQHD